ncbi:cyclic nucleotide-binding protein [marine bacterium AO1-C]|nr:cyclic nucleotide-binding protein [marine bacterium AO1-C]
MFQALFDFIRLLVDIPKSDQEQCCRFFKPIFVKKNALLESEGTIHRYHNFIVSGHMRNFYHDSDGKEVTTDLNSGPRFFTSYNSFIQKTVSNENLHCITDCKLLRINRQDNEIIARNGARSQEYVEKILQYNLEANRQRVIDLKTLTAKQRYLKMMQDTPSIIRNVPVAYIASFLGINPGSLSRIRQELL